MDITADYVQRTCSYTQNIDNSVLSIMKTFQLKIQEASKCGLCGVVVAVPTNFETVGMSNTTAQTIIYNRLIEELEDRGFNVAIVMEDSIVTYGIKWSQKKSDSRLRKMRDNIAKHVVQTKKPRQLTNSRTS